MIVELKRNAVCAGIFAILGMTAVCLAQPPGTGQVEATSHPAQASQPALGPTAAELAAAIPLGTSSGDQGKEVWELSYGSRSVRNVTFAAIIPVLPDPAKATGVAVIVAPGGGFTDLEIQREGYSIAQQLADRGIAAFVLKYRTRPTPADPAEAKAEDAKRTAERSSRSSMVERIPTTPAEAAADAAASVKLLRSRASEWGIDPHHIGYVGFSAGAVLGESLVLDGDKSAWPDFLAPIYGSMASKPVPADAPPVFFAIALDDPLFAVHSSLGLIDTWRKSGRPVEAHLYMKGSHAFAGSNQTKGAALWFDEFYAWIRDLGWIAN